LLLNIALHGMEAALGVQHNGRGEIVGKRAVVRYADDFVVFCESQEDALAVKDRILPEWLGQRGLFLSQKKTRVVHLTEGFDFLGVNIRRYRRPRSPTGYKLLIKPSKKSVAAIRENLRGLGRQGHGQAVQVVLACLNPVIRGWTYFFRTVVSSRAFACLDAWMHRRAERYVNRTHPHKSSAWRKARYWGRLHPQRNDHWVFGDKGTGRYLLKFSWVQIIRHQLVRGTASPDDPDLREYWWQRQKVNLHHLNPSDVRLALAQHGVCPVCGMPLGNAEPLERPHKRPRALGGDDSYANRELVHLYCHQQRTAAQRRGPPTSA
jgi:RNA-directed DNA polymerase